MSRSIDRWSAPVSGLAFTLLLFLRLAVVDPIRGVDDDALRAWWGNGDNLANLATSMVLRLASMPFLVVFLAQLRHRLRRSEPSVWPDVVAHAGVVAASMLGLSAMTRGVVTQGMYAGDPLPGADVLRVVTSLSYEAYAIAVIGTLAFVLVVAGLRIHVTAALPRWLGWLGIAVGVGSLAAVALRMGAWASPFVLVWFVAASAAMAGRARG